MPRSFSAPFSVRLFPKNQGADAYEVTGIAARCDWVLLSDEHDPKLQLCKIRPTDHPSTIFVSLRNPVVALRHFYFEILPNLDTSFVLVSGSEDVTLPIQTDARWPAFDASTRDIIKEIAASPKVLHWFAENLDSKFSSQISPLPTGMVYPDNNVPDAMDRPVVPPLESRPTRVLVGHRLRPGAQWELSRKVSNLVGAVWSDFTTHLTQEIPEPEFLQMVSEHSFVLCVEGGGTDPSPKAWQVLQYGAIPIIRKSPLWEAYRDFPCVAIDDWKADCISVEQLHTWKSERVEAFDAPDMRDQLFERLSIDFWWQKILSKGPAHALS